MSTMIVGRDRANGDNPREWDVDIKGAGLLRGDPENPIPTTATAPAAATSVGALAPFTVDSSEAALSGTSNTGFTLVNTSTGGQSIRLGDVGVAMTGPGLTLDPGDSIDRERWQDLSIVHAVASADGATLEACPL